MEIIIALLWFGAALFAFLCMIAVTPQRLSLAWACALCIILTQALPVIAAAIK